MRKRFLLLSLFIFSGMSEAGQYVSRGSYMGLSIDAYGMEIPRMPAVHYSVFTRPFAFDVQVPLIRGLFAVSAYLNLPKLPVLPFLSYGNMIQWQGYGHPTSAFGVQWSPDRSRRLYFNLGFLGGFKDSVYSPYFSIGLRHRL